MAFRYCRHFPPRRTTTGGAIRHSEDNGDVVLVTGTTGNLGCYLLDALVSSSEVRLVYALNRASRDGASLLNRQKEALRHRGLDPQIPHSPKVILLEGSLTDPTWGLPVGVYEQVHRSTTHIIHNAWQVDMIARLPAFKSLLEGLRCLVDFALTSPRTSPPRLLFTSSTAMLQYASRESPVLERPVKPEVTAACGYTKSKWVAEQILYAAAAQTDLDPLVVRVGQASGGKSGAWAVNEWYPLMAQSAAQLGCYPNDLRPINFIPYEYAAAALLDFRKASNASHTVHLVHPDPTSWQTLARVIAREFGVPLVPFSEWVARLEAAAATLPQDTIDRRRRIRDLRVLQVMEWFQDMLRVYYPAHMALGFPDVDMVEAMKASQTLADPNLPRVSEEDVRRWLTYWRKVGLLGKCEQPLARL
ncbi:uncharacterized protein FIBRA_00021 [Fibroporia radiculosa]|uniref:Thioester reductase (TE) domain-containing protein n=1 Tax=Fibroporia radiculosa TaxID=599839 RepID=J7SCD8_9APHY|nr:uncharacterized protein FIBRA_00021 [Fibroporia radiculosa]CCL98028.1 predicted protein [Fibroporia radiculosa]